MFFYNLMVFFNSKFYVKYFMALNSVYLFKGFLQYNIFFIIFNIFFSKSYENTLVFSYPSYNNCNSDFFVIYKDPKVQDFSGLFFEKSYENVSTLLKTYIFDSSMFSLGILCVVVALFAYLLLFIGTNISPNKFNEEKGSPYECGYEPFEDARVTFDVQFYLVGILFLIFDIEVTFVIPLCLVHSTVPFTSILIIYFFLYLLVLGFFFEFKRKAILW